MKKSISQKVKDLKKEGGKWVNVTRIRGTDNVRIKGKYRGSSTVVKQVTGNVGLTARSVVLANKSIAKKRRKRK